MLAPDPSQRDVGPLHHPRRPLHTAAIPVVESGGRSPPRQLLRCEDRAQRRAMSAELPHAQPGSRRRRAALPAAATALTALLCGCGHVGPANSAVTHRHLTAACTSGALAAMGRTLGVATSSIRTAASTANNAMPQCAFSTQLHGKHVEMTLNVDNGPQPYFVLERTIVEASQIFPVRRPARRRRRSPASGSRRPGSPP